MAILTLIELNNTIVGLRKSISKAEVHIIHKLSRQVKNSIISIAINKTLCNFIKTLPDLDFTYLSNYYDIHRLKLCETEKQLATTKRVIGSRFKIQEKQIGS